MKRILFPILTLVLAIGLTLPMATPVAAHTAGDPQVSTLLAGQTIDVGNVSVWNDTDYLWVKMSIDAPDWRMTETHLAVATSLAAIPQTGSGNPKVGKFPYKMEYDPADVEKIYLIPLNSWTPGTTLYIAAHAVVVQFDEFCQVIQKETAWACGLPFPGRSWATYFTYRVQPDGNATAGSTAEWVEDTNDIPTKTGDHYYHLETNGSTAGDSRATIQFELSDGITLADIQEISWWTWLVSGYVPHMELYLNTDADPDPDAILIAEGAYTNGDSTTGWDTGSWFQTFDGVTAAYPSWAGLSGTPNLTQVDGTTAVWLSPSSYTPDQFSIDKLSVYQSVAGKEGINGSTPVLYCQIEIDNWVAETEVYVDDVEITLAP